MDLYPLGFEKQKLFTMWACGAYSFGHLLNLFAIPNYIDDNIRTCQTIPHPISFKFWNGGTSELSIKRALKRIGFKPKEYYEYYDALAKKAIDNYSNNNQPLIISVDEDRHWMLLVKRYKDKYIIIDSGGSEHNTILLYKWETLRRRWKTECDDCEGDKVEWCAHCDGYGEDETGYCNKCEGFGYIRNCRNCKGSGFRFYAIVPSRTQIKSINDYALKNIDRYIKTLRNNYSLQEWWGYYLNDLLDISGYNFGNKKGHIPLAELFTKQYDSIIEALGFWFAEIDKDDLEYEIGNYVFVAKAYQLSIPERKREQALILFSSALISTLIY